MLGFVISAGAIGVAVVYVMPRVLAFVQPLLPAQIAGNRIVNVLVIGAVAMASLAAVAFALRAFRVRHRAL